MAFVGKNQLQSQCQNHIGLMVFVFHVILLIITALCSVMWGFSWVFGFLFRYHIPHIQQFPNLPLPTYPKLSVIIPACNEGSTIAQSLRTILSQTYPNLEIVLINDRSTDDTGAQMAQMAHQDSRVQVIHIEELPDGWLGKVHAMHRGTQVATGDWLLFTDADVHFAVGFLEQSITYAEQNILDHLCVLPAMKSRSLWAQSCIMSALRGIMIGFRPWHIHNPKRKEAVGVGAFNLLRRSHFEKTEGFEWFKLDVADDIALGFLMKNSGGKPGVLIATEQVTVEWYDSLRGLTLGLEKNAYSQMAQFSLFRGIALSLMLMILVISPFYLLLQGAFWLPLLAFFGMILNTIILNRTMYAPLLPTLLSFVFGDLFLAFVILRSSWLGHKRGGVIWRGTVYDSETLKKGTKVWLG